MNQNNLFSVSRLINANLHPATELTLHRVKRHVNKTSIEDFPPCAIILNNNLSGGRPEILKAIRQLKQKQFIKISVNKDYGNSTDQKMSKETTPNHFYAFDNIGHLELLQQIKQTEESHLV